MRFALVLMLFGSAANATEVTFDFTSAPADIEYYGGYYSAPLNSTHAWWTMGEFAFEVNGTPSSPGGSPCSAVVWFGGYGMTFALDAVFSIRRTGYYEQDGDEYPNTSDLVSFDALIAPLFSAPSDYRVTGYYYDQFYGDLPEEHIYNINSTTVSTYANQGELPDYMMGLDFEVVDQLTDRITLKSVTVQYVPIPAAVWLFGSALAGLGWMRRKQAV